MGVDRRGREGERERREKRSRKEKERGGVSQEAIDIR
jgi:hypothetical protein